MRSALLICLAFWLIIDLAPTGAAGAPVAVAVPTGGLTDWGHTPFYAQTGWAGAHRDGRNSDFVPFVVPAANQVAWTALDGLAILPAPVLGPEGQLYAVSGGGPGTRHLHAFDRAGNLLWQSEPELSPADLDSLAALSSPTLDRQGNIYLGDGNQFWSFAPDGTVRWVADLPEAGVPMASSIITPQGLVGGITLNGKVVLFDRADGSLAGPVLDLPGGPGQPATGLPPGLWAGGLMDPAIIPMVHDVLFGFGFEVINTPAAHPQSGRLYITATGATPAEGVLYGLSLVGGALAIDFAAPMGGGSGTSPAVSFDGARVYAADGLGVMRAFDAATGAEIWAAGGAGLATSPTVGPDETVYTGSDELLALDPTTGAVLWGQAFDDLAADFLPALPPDTPYVATGLPVGRPDGVVTASADRVLVVVVLGYDLVLPPNGATMLWPGLTGLAAVDPEDGALQGFTLLQDTNEGVISADPDGSVALGHAAVLSSIVYYGLNPILPPELQLPGPPAGGFSVLAPASQRAQAAEGAGWARELAVSAESALPDGDLAAAFTAVRRGRVQLEATARTIPVAVAQGELDPATAAAARYRVRQGYIGLLQARAVLAQPAPSLPALLWADARLQGAIAALDAALALLAP